MITTGHQQEFLSRAYAEIVVARCGMAWSRPEPDYGVDMILHLVDTVEGRLVQSGYPLEIQLKSTIRAVVKDDEIRYDLDADAYARLRNPKVGSERILVLLVLPRTDVDWTVISEEGLLLRGCAYWLSLKGYPVRKRKTSVRIYIPRRNIFSVEALGAIMDRVCKGKGL